jgi:hypothetical protein
MSTQEVQLLVDRFDREGDGAIDMNEFQDFMDKELSQLTHGEVQLAASGSTAATAPPTKVPAGSLSPSASKGRATDARRPQSAGADNLRRSSSAQNHRGINRPGSASLSRSSSRGSDSRSHSLPEYTARDGDGYGDDSLSYSTAPPPDYSRTHSTATIRSADGDDVHGDQEYKHNGGDNSGNGNYNGHSLTVEGPHDVMWLSQVLQAQSHIEAKLGRKYFGTV